MKTAPNALTLKTVALSSLLSVFILPLQGNAQTNPPPATATRPGEPEQTSIPNNAPPASRTQVTGKESQDPMIKKMNEDEKQKVEKEGK